MNLTAMERLVLAKIGPARRHSRSFHVAKPVVASLVAKGLVKRVGDKKVYIEVTELGREALS